MAVVVTTKSAALCRGNAVICLVAAVEQAVAIPTRSAALMNVAAKRMVKAVVERYAARKALNAANKILQILLAAIRAANTMEISFAAVSVNSAVITSTVVERNSNVVEAKKFAVIRILNSAVEIAVVKSLSFVALIKMEIQNVVRLIAVEISVVMKT